MSVCPNTPSAMPFNNQHQCTASPGISEAPADLVVGENQGHIDTTTADIVAHAVPGLSTPAPNTLLCSSCMTRSGKGRHIAVLGDTGPTDMWGSYASASPTVVLSISNSLALNDYRLVQDYLDQ